MKISPPFRRNICYVAHVYDKHIFRETSPCGHVKVQRYKAYSLSDIHVILTVLARIVTHLWTSVCDMCLSGWDSSSHDNHLLTKSDRDLSTLIGCDPDRNQSVC